MAASRHRLRSFSLWLLLWGGLGLFFASEAALRGKVFRSLKLLRDALEQKGVAYAM